MYVFFSVVVDRVLCVTIKNTSTIMFYYILFILIMQPTPQLRETERKNLYYQ